MRTKRSQFGRSGGAPEGEIYKTNPICPGRLSPWRSDSAKRTQFGAGRQTWGPLPGSIVQNEPNLAGRNAQNEPNSRWGRARRGLGDGGRGGKCAKRTQFGGPIVRNKANCALEEVGRGRPTHEETIMRNEAKLGRVGASGGRRMEPEKGTFCFFPRREQSRMSPPSQSSRMPFWWSQCFRSPISLKISLS